ncbi:MAG: branched-chain amino acid ABC transporter permease [Desulfosalsimonas sp.]
MLSQIFLLGLFKGSVYALIAIGFTLIFGVARILNLGHGTFYMFGAYLTYAIAVYFQFPAFLCLLLASLAVGLIGMGFYYFILRPLHSIETYILVITLAFALLGQYVMFAVFGSRARNLSYFVSGTFDVLGVSLSNHRLIIFLIFLVVVAGIFLFLKATSYGKAIRALSQNQTASLLMGIEPAKMFTLTFGIASFLAALAGGVISPLWNVEPTMWFFPLIKAFSIVVLGGLGSIPGSIIGAFILAYAETATSLLISDYLANMVALAILIIVLLVKPSGIMGKLRE